MSRILRRLMFRGGSPNNGGIMSYAQPRKGYANSYLYGVGNENSTDLNTYVKFPFNMRTDPTLIAGSGTDFYRFDRNGGTDYVDSFTLNMSMPTNAIIYNNTQASGTAGQAGHLFLNNDGAYIAFNAEL